METDTFELVVHQTGGETTSIFHNREQALRLLAREVERGAYHVVLTRKLASGSSIVIAEHKST